MEKKNDISVEEQSFLPMEIALNSIKNKVDKIFLNMEKMKFVDYVSYLENPRKLLFSNFIGGVSRGFGMAIGFTALSGAAIYVLQFIVRLNLPLISEYIADFIKLIQNEL